MKIVSENRFSRKTYFHAIASSVLPVVFAQLPLKEDHEEYPIVYRDGGSTEFYTGNGNILYDV